MKIVIKGAGGVGVQIRSGVTFREQNNCAIPAVVYVIVKERGLPTKSKTLLCIETTSSVPKLRWYFTFLQKAMESICQLSHFLLVYHYH